MPDKFFLVFILSILACKFAISDYNFYSTMNTT